MEPAQALADLVEISSQIEAVVLLDADGTVVATTLGEGGGAAELGAIAQQILARADEAAGTREAVQVEVSLLDGSVFVVRSDGRTIVATTRPDPTVGLVLYDLRSCLRNAAAEPAKPARSRGTRAKKKQTGDDGAAA